jgi:hypothetical protein
MDVAIATWKSGFIGWKLVRAVGNPQHLDVASHWWSLQVDRHFAFWTAVVSPLGGVILVSTTMRRMLI